MSEVVTSCPRLKVMMLAVGLEVGGTERQLLDVSSRLDPRRFNAIVCVLKGEGAIGHELRDRGVKLIALHGKGKWDVRVIYRLWRVMRTERPDIVHAFLFLANIAARVIGRLLRVPVVIGSYRGVEIWKSRLYVFVDRLTAGWAHSMTCCSHAVRQDAMARIGGPSEKYVAIYNGVDIARFAGRTSLTRGRIGLPDGVPAVGVVCRLSEPTKGLTILLEAFARLVRRPQMEHCRLLVVGDGPARRMLEDLAIRLGLSENVVFAGMRRDVESVMPLVDLFVLPSRYEGFGIAIVEAMAASRPVVASAVGGIPEIVVHGQTGFLVAPGDVGGLVEAMWRVLRHPEQAVLYGLAGLERVRERFSIEATVRRHEELYETLFAASGAAMRPEVGLTGHCGLLVNH
jgi:glycosyltransferase involved in cell wall biosynthesis